MPLNIFLTWNSYVYGKSLVHFSKIPFFPSVTIYSLIFMFLNKDFSALTGLKVKKKKKPEKELLVSKWSQKSCGFTILKQVISPFWVFYVFIIHLHFSASGKSVVCALLHTSNYVTPSFWLTSKIPFKLSIIANYMFY